MNRPADFIRRLYSTDFTNQAKGEFQGSTGSPGRNQSPIHYHLFLCIDRGEFSGNGFVGGVSCAIEDACIVKKKGGGANCSYGCSSRMVPTDKFEHVVSVSQGKNCRAAREYEQVEVSRLGVCEKRIGFDGDTRSTNYLDRFTTRNDQGLDARSAQQVYGAGCLDFFKAFCQEDKRLSLLFQVFPVLLGSLGFFGLWLGFLLGVLWGTGFG